MNTLSIVEERKFHSPNTEEKLDSSAEEIPYPILDSEKNSTQNVVKKNRFFKKKVDSRENLQADLQRQIVELKQENSFLEKTFREIQQFIESDQELFSKFGECVKKTKDILLPPPIQQESAQLSNSLVEQWRQEAQKKHQYECMKTRFREFLEKNPEFSALFKQKYDEKIEASSENSTNHREFRDRTFFVELPSMIVEMSKERNVLTEDSLETISTNEKRGFQRFSLSLRKTFSSSKSDTGHQVRLLQSLLKNNDKELKKMRKIKNRLLGDNELMNHFKIWIDSFTTIENSIPTIDNSKLLESCQLTVEYADQLAKSIIDFLALMKQNDNEKLLKKSISSLPKKESLKIEEWLETKSTYRDSSINKPTSLMEHVNE